jgi:hypothetical protein
MIVEGTTIKEMAAKLGRKPSLVKHQLFVAGIKPLIREAIYPLDTLEAIRNVPGKGRPRKPKPKSDP